MARTLDRPTVHPTEHPEVHPDIHPDVHPDVDEFIRTTLDEHEARRALRRPIRWMRWLAAIALLIVAGGITLLVLARGEDTQYAVPRTADGAERWLEYTTPEYAVPSTADGAEGWIEATAPEYAVPTTADGTVRWLTYTTDFRPPRTADGSVAWFEHLTARVPQTADGTVAWLQAIEASNVPVLVELEPIPQFPVGAPVEVSYLPVTPPTPVVPGEQIVLSVQPILVSTDVPIAVAPVLVEMGPIPQFPVGAPVEVSYLPVTPPTPVVPGEQIVLAVEPILVSID